MNISSYASNGKVFTNMECIKGYAFKIALAGVDSALLPVMTSGLGRSVYRSAHLSRPECLPPYDTAC